MILHNDVYKNSIDCTKIFEKEHLIGILPKKFLFELFKILKMHDAEFITCGDLPFNCSIKPISTDAYCELCNMEYAAWLKTAQSHKTYYMLMHDTDSGPAATINVGALEQSMGLRSTISTYAAWAWPPIGPCAYPIDFDRLKTFQDTGFCIAYHCNVASRPDFAPEKAYDMFDADVDFLTSRGFNIRFYSSHGGPQTHAGLSNTSFYYPAHARHKLISTHNVYGISAGSHFSDGALASESRKLTGDIRHYLKERITPGDRHKILLHPQYYCAVDDSVAQKLYGTHLWIKEYWDLYKQDATALYWKQVIHAMALKAVK